VGFVAMRIGAESQRLLWYQWVEVPIHAQRRLSGFRGWTISLARIMLQAGGTSKHCMAETSRSPGNRKNVNSS
jgi:hypothetical protein